MRTKFPSLCIRDAFKYFFRCPSRYDGKNAPLTCDHFKCNVITIACLLIVNTPYLPYLHVCYLLNVKYTTINSWSRLITVQFQLLAFFVRANICHIYVMYCSAYFCIMVTELSNILMPANILPISSVSSHMQASLPIFISHFFKSHTFSYYKTWNF